MDQTSDEPTGPDLSRGVPVEQLPDGAHLAGHFGEDMLLVSRRGDDYFAISAVCSHWAGPLNEGLVSGDTVRCPWHHACFSLRTGEALHAPALDPVACWQVEVSDGLVFVRGPINPPRTVNDPDASRAVVIIGGGAAGNAAAEMLRREDYQGRITILSADESPPCDRPNLSKDYLAGVAPEEFALLRSDSFYSEQAIDLKLGTRVTAIDSDRRRVTTADGSEYQYDALLLATGAEPVRLDVPGNDRPQVHYLRSLTDARALVAAAQTGRRAVVIGASFIGMEVSASLRQRGVAVDVVAPDAVPMERVLGREVGEFLRGLHERHGVTFHLGATVTSIGPETVTLSDGTTLPADLVVVGIGVRPALDLAAQAGVALDRGVLVDRYLETSVPGIFAAGDIARWPDPLSGTSIRVEHWVVAERQGQVAARNMLGRREPFEAVPFFWTTQYDVSVSYVGHAAGWDQAERDGQLDAERQDCRISYRKAGKEVAVATVARDGQSLEAELRFEETLREKVATTGGGTN